MVKANFSAPVAPMAVGTGYDWMNPDRLKSQYSDYASMLPMVQQTAQSVYNMGYKPSQMGISPYVWNPTNARYERKAVDQVTPEDIATRWLQQQQEAQDLYQTQLQQYNATPRNSFDHTPAPVAPAALNKADVTPEKIIEWMGATDIKPYEHTQSWFQKNAAPALGIGLGLATLGGLAPLAGVGNLFGGGTLGAMAQGATGSLLSGAKGKDILTGALTGGAGAALGDIAKGAQSAASGIKGGGMAATVGSKLGAATQAAQGGGKMGGLFGNIGNALSGVLGGLSGSGSGDTLQNVLKLAAQGYISNPSSPLTGAASILGNQLVDPLLGNSGILNDAASGWLENRAFGLNGGSGALYGALGGALDQKEGSLGDQYLQGMQYGLTPQQMLMATLTGQGITPQLAAGMKNDNWLPMLTGQGMNQTGQASGQAGAQSGVAGQTGGLGGGLDQLLGGLGGAGGALSGLLGGLGGSGGGGALGSLMPLLLPYLASTLGGKSDSAGGAAGVPDDTLSALNRTAALDTQRQTKELMDAQRASMLRRGLGNSGIFDQNERQLLSDIARQQQAANDANTIAASQNALTWQNRADKESQANQDARAGLVGTLLPLLFPQGPSSIIQNILGGPSASAGTGATGGSTLPATGNYNPVASTPVSWNQPTATQNMMGSLLNVFSNSKPTPTANYGTDSTYNPYGTKIPSTGTSGGIMPSAWESSVYNPKNQTSPWGATTVGGIRTPVFR